MKRIILMIQLLLAAVFCCPAVYGQNNASSPNIISKLTSFTAAHLSEKAYLQFDKPYYAAGDTAYFKAYITEGERHQLSDVSSVLHVELINTKNNIDQSIRLRLDSGVAWGDFALPDSLPAGNYRIRAYTQWMRNEGENGFFDKIIPIVSLKAAKVPENLVKQPVQPAIKPDVQFFPEGGSFVSGIRAKVAFKAIGPNGQGIDAKGKIIDNDHNEVASIASAHLGMGYFYLDPKEGETYTAKITFPNGEEGTFVLPKPETSGIVLSVNNDSLPSASVRIETSPDYYRLNRNKQYTLVIYSPGIASTVNCKLDSPLIKLDILKRKLHTGVATVTLFSPENEPLCERLLFIQNYDQLNLGINSNKNSYAKREKVNIALNAINRKGNPAAGHFSVSVVNEDKVPETENNGENILTWLLLSSDLKGYIEQPGYYFADASAMARNNLDVLMLTQGYRKFEWKQVLDSANERMAYQPETGIDIEGQVKNLFNKPIANGTVTLLPAHGGSILSSTTDEKGMFRFSNLVFTDTAHFVLSAVNAAGRNSTKITYFNTGFNEPPLLQNQLPNKPRVNDTALASFIGNRKLQQQEFLKYGKPKGILLKEVNIRERKADDQYRTFSLAGAGNADQVMHADEIERIQGELSTSLNGRLRGIVFNRGIPYLLGVGMMAVYVDGERMNISTREPLGINILNTNDIETVEVLKYGNAAIYGADGGHGVLVITTKAGGVDTKNIASIGVLPIAPMGFYKAREFYSPKYDNVDWTGKQKDLRSTIYWKPEIRTGKDGNATFEYYNADGSGTYKIVIEGIDSDGNLGRQVLRYQVE